MIRSLFQNLKDQRIPVLPRYLLQIKTHRDRIEDSQPILLFYHGGKTKPKMILFLTGIIEKIRKRSALSPKPDLRPGVLLHIKIEGPLFPGEHMAEGLCKPGLTNPVNGGIDDNQTPAALSRYQEQSCIVLIQARLHNLSKNPSDGLIFIDRNLLFPYFRTLLTCQYKSSGGPAHLPLLIGNLIPDQQKLRPLELF